jgi:hypothetical protein
MATTFATTGAERASPPYDGFDRMLLNDGWKHGRSGQIAEDVDPYTNEVLLWIEEFTTVHWISLQHEPVAYPF